MISYDPTDAVPNSAVTSSPTPKAGIKEGAKQVIFTGADKGGFFSHIPKMNKELHHYAQASSLPI